MGWRLRIRHHTGFQYAGKVVASYNEARLTPLTTNTQNTLDARLEMQAGGDPHAATGTTGAPRSRPSTCMTSTRFSR